MSDIKLFPGPRLERHEWGYDEASASGAWKADVVTDRAHEYLYRNVEVSPDVTLADILGLLASNPVLLAVYRQEFVEELCAEFKKGPIAPTGEDWENLEYLELYQVWSLDSATGAYQSAGKFSLHGAGIVQAEDILEHGHVRHKKGERIHWGVSVTPLREMLHLPVRVNPKVLICENGLDSCNYGETVQTASNSQITLGSFLRETLWELSFHGGPDESATFREDLMEQVEEVKAGTAETVAYEDIFESLGFNSRNSVYNQFFDAWNQAEAHELYHALHGVEDTQPVQAGLQAVLGEGVVVKPEFAGLPAREFRKLVRLAQCEAP